MATDTMTMGSAADAVRPYPPSWIDRLIAWIDGLPGPALAYYAILLVISIVASNAANWLSGLLPLGTFTLSQTFWGIWTIALLWIVAYLNGVAHAAFEAFEPAISMSAADRARARYALTTIPARPAIIVGLVSVPFTAMYYVADPTAAGVVGLTPSALLIRGASEAFSTAILILVIYHAFRQLRLVGRLHAGADRIDPFLPAPVYAFSRLTAATGIALIGTTVAGFLFSPAKPDQASYVYIYLPWIVGFPLVAAVIFVVPLRGMHARLVGLKARLRADADVRLKRVLAELNADIDGLDLARADGLNKTLASLLQQREVIARLPTWPWSAGTIRGFGSALLLPIVIFLMQRYLGAILPT